MAGLTDFVISLDRMGVYDVALPFIVMFTITFALLEKVKLFQRREINAILGFAFGLLFLQNDYLLSIFHRFVPNISFIILVLILGMLLVGIFAGENQAWSGWMLFGAFLFSIVSVFAALGSDVLEARDFFLWWDALGPDARTLIVVVIVLIVFFVVLMKGDRERTNQPGFIESFERNLKGGNRR